MTQSICAPDLLANVLHHTWLQSGAGANSATATIARVRAGRAPRPESEPEEPEMKISTMLSYAGNFE
jgi:hypothetical protein